MDSQYWIYVIEIDEKNAEKSLQIDTFVLRKSYEKVELYRIWSIPGVANPADILTKFEICKSSELLTVRKRNRFKLVLIGWDSLENK